MFLIGEVLELIIGVVFYWENGGVMEVFICGLGFYFLLIVVNGCVVINGFGD